MCLLRLIINNNYSKDIFLQFWICEKKLDWTHRCEHNVQNGFDDFMLEIVCQLNGFGSMEFQDSDVSIQINHRYTPTHFTDYFWSAMVRFTRNTYVNFLFSFILVNVFIQIWIWFQFFSAPQRIELWTPLNCTNNSQCRTDCG